jgi:uncharacterized membrane protein
MRAVGSKIPLYDRFLYEIIFIRIEFLVLIWCLKGMNFLSIINGADHFWYEVKISTDMLEH